MLKIAHFVLLSFFFCAIACTNQQSEPIREEAPVKPTFIEQKFKLPAIPSEMNFCDEIIDLTDIDIRERLDRELLINTYYHSSTILYLKRANRFFPKIESILKEENLPSDIKYLAVAESGLSQATSPAGAKGFWQFMPQTGQEYGLVINNKIDERYHLEKSTRAACQYLKASKEKLESWFSAIASYNRGVGGVQSDMNWQGTEDYFDTYMNNETGRYVFRMLALKLIMENPTAYGFDLDASELYQPYETISVNVVDGIDDVADWSKQHNTNYKIVKLLNPWITSNSLPKSESLMIQLPAETMNLNPRSKGN